MFLEKRTGQAIPNESTLRKYYVKTIYSETLSKIQGIIKIYLIFIFFLS